MPVDGSRASLNALSLACGLAKRNRGRVHAVYVIEVTRRLPLDANLGSETKRGEEILKQARQVADSLDSEVADDLLQARDAGPAIVDEAIERTVDSIILGITYKRPIEEYSGGKWMGSTAQYVLKNAPCQVILFRAPVGGSEA